LCVRGTTFSTNPGESIKVFKLWYNFYTVRNRKLLLLIEDDRGYIFFSLYLLMLSDKKEALNRAPPNMEEIYMQDTPRKSGRKGYLLIKIIA